MVEDVPDDLVGAPLEGRDKLVAVAEMVEDQVADPVHRSLLSGLAVDECQGDEPACLRVAPERFLKGYPQMREEIHPGEIASAPVVAGQTDGTPGALLKQRPGAEEGETLDRDE